MKKITILCGRYLPGYKDGGPVRTIVNLVESLGNQYEFNIITNDRDHGDKKPYPNILYDKSNRIGKANVFYIKPGEFTLKNIKKLTINTDIIYVCGPYNNYSYKVLLLKRMNIIKQPVVVASMGSFSEGALKIKGKKKKIFIEICKKIGLYQKISWSVTSKREENDVKNIIGKESICYIAEDLPRKINKVDIREVKKNNKELKIVFISRICKIKNLIYVIEILKEIHGKVVFDIYGPIEDEVYWKECKRLLEKLPSNIKYSYCGMMDSEKIVDTFLEYDIFVFPTMGENFGHVIFEALSGGCIPIISDQTPWQDLEEEKCGRIIPLDKKNEYINTINKILKMQHEDLMIIQEKANEYAMKKYNESIKNTGYIDIFR